MMLGQSELARDVESDVATEAGEQEVARIVADIAAHIHSVSKRSGGSSYVKLALLGRIEEFRRPVGTCAIVSNGENPLRWVLGPLAASIAAGNVTVLALSASSGDDCLSALLSREWKKYLDRDCNFFVSPIEPASLSVGMFDAVRIFGVCACFCRSPELICQRGSQG
jgi:hypothetical protein